jgi:hypothetical protein
MSGHERNNTSPAGHEYRGIHIDKGAKAHLGDTNYFGWFLAKHCAEAGALTNLGI